MDGLSTLAKIKEEKRTLEAVERKRKAREEAQRAAKRRKTGNGSCERNRPEEDPQCAATSEAVPKGDARQKSLSRHTSTASAAESGITLV